MIYKVNRAKIINIGHTQSTNKQLVQIIFQISFFFQIKQNLVIEKGLEHRRTDEVGQSHLQSKLFPSFLNQTRQKNLHFKNIYKQTCQADTNSHILSIIKYSNRFYRLNAQQSQVKLKLEFKTNIQQVIQKAHTHYLQHNFIQFALIIADSQKQLINQPLKSKQQIAYQPPIIKKFNQYLLFLEDFQKFTKLRMLSPTNEA
eukprot:TRINITY_DN336_c1_g1_i2.p1 TRINITY_DN336_c1_g1~~TRINITY_DN336_c1_g1_i2.p1  ORF type:complete len:201 (+),score=-10.60 TRINITY_DN336_c1_g1_i2:129-731(+)